MAELQRKLNQRRAVVEHGGESYESVPAPSARDSPRKSTQKPMMTAPDEIPSPSRIARQRRFSREFKESMSERRQVVEKAPHFESTPDPKSDSTIDLVPQTTPKVTESCSQQDDLATLPEVSEPSPSTPQQHDSTGDATTPLLLPLPPLCFPPELSSPQ